MVNPEQSLFPVRKCLFSSNSIKPIFSLCQDFIVLTVYDPRNSNDHSVIFLHWWPKKNTTEWVQYDFDEEYTISESSVYWFDDGPSGGCRIPASWKILYKEGDNWVPVKNLTPYEISKDKYNGIKFEPLKTKALRIGVQLPADFATGLHEWSVK